VSFRERISILLFGKVFVGVYSSSPVQPPLWIKGTKEIFKKKNSK